MLIIIRFQQLSVHALDCILETVSFLNHCYLANEISCIAAKEIFLEAVMNVNVGFMRNEFLYMLNCSFFPSFSVIPHLTKLIYQWVNGFVIAAGIPL